MSKDFDHQVLSKNNFGLVDSAMIEYLPETIIGTTLVPLALAKSAHLMPTLLDFRSMSDAQRTALLESLYEAHRYDEQPVVAVFVESPDTAEEFARYWNALQLVAPSHDRKFWLRLHDPRVLHQLLRIATIEQRRRLFGHSRTFTYWLGSEWVLQEANSGKPLASGTQTSVGSLCFSGATKWDWARIERIGMVNRTLIGAGVCQPDQLNTKGAVAEQLFERAFRFHGLVHTDDIVEFAIRGLTMGSQFDEHPSILSAIRHIPDDSVCLADRFALIDDLVWSELRQFPSTC